MHTLHVEVSYQSKTPPDLQYVDTSHCHDDHFRKAIACKVTVPQAVDRVSKTVLPQQLKCQCIHGYGGSEGIKHITCTGTIGLGTTCDSCLVHQQLLQMPTTRLCTLQGAKGGRVLPCHTSPALAHCFHPSSHQPQLHIPHCRIGVSWAELCSGKSHLGKRRCGG